MSNLNFNMPIKANRNNEVHSKFITEGKILEKIQYNDLYSVKNFEIVLDKNKNQKILGSGSYGQVYLCKNKINNKLYAIKHMDIGCLKRNLKNLSGIYAEIKLQSIIMHPNIVQLLYSRKTDKSFDLVMEWASNGSLFDYIRKKKYLTEEMSFNYFIQVANAIYFLHQNDLIHRDIKPENLLLYDNNNIKLCDFGWCVELKGGQRGTFCGTTEYMAPEMVNQKVYSKEIDIWSLGVLLYEMLHGYSPFIPKKQYFDETEVMENIKIHNLKFDINISKECKELIRHLLDENRQKRYTIEDVFNSNFVKKYEKKLFNKIIINNNNLIKGNNNDINNNNKNIQNIQQKEENKNTQFNQKDNNFHSKCKTNNFNNQLINNNNINKDNINQNENINKRVKIINRIVNKTANYFYRIKNDKKNNDKLKENGMITPRKKNTGINSGDIPIDINSLEKYKISPKISKDKDRKNNSSKLDESIEKEHSKQIKNIINVKDKKKNISDNNFEMKHINQKNNDDSFTIIPLNEDEIESSIINNYSFETENKNKNKNEINNDANSNKITIIKKHPVNIGNSNINNNIGHINLQKKKPVKNINENKINWKKEEYSNNPMCNSPNIIRNNISNIKQKKKIIIKNNSSNLLRNQNNNYNINNIKNNTNKNIKMKNNTDYNYFNFKNTPDKELLNPGNNLNDGDLFSSSNNSNQNIVKDLSENIFCKNYIIINNNNNIISPSMNDEHLNRKQNFKKDKNNFTNNIIVEPYSKLSKTPVKKMNNKKIKNDKGTIDYYDSKNDNNHHKSKIKIKSKSCIKNIIKTDKTDLQNELIDNDNDILLTNPNNNNIFTLNMKPKIMDEGKQKIELPSIMDYLFNNSRENNNNDILNKTSKMNNNIISLNKTIKIKNFKKKIEDDSIRNKQNNSFSGRKELKKIIEDENNICKMISPIREYNSKKIELKKNTKMIINEKESDDGNNDNSENEQQKTPRKTKDKVKIFPCKLISEISHKFK